jgi:hypothetical protein
VRATGNTDENLTSLLTWRAAGVAVYGGNNNVFRNIHIADTLVYSGITISSLDFGIPMNGFGNPSTPFDNISVMRAGGHFWGARTFPTVWVFSASKVFTAIRVSYVDVDIVDPTYSGIMFQTNYVGGQPQFPVADTVCATCRSPARGAAATLRMPSPTSVSGLTSGLSRARVRRSARPRSPAW